MRFDYIIETPCETPSSSVTTTTGSDVTSTTGGDVTTTTGADVTTTTGGDVATTTPSACEGCEDPSAIVVAGSTTYDGDWSVVTWNVGVACFGLFTGPSPEDAFDAELSFDDAENKWKLDLDNGNVLFKTTEAGCPIGDYEGSGATAGWTATIS